MAVQAQLDSPWRVAAHLHEQRPKVFVVDVEVVVVDVNRLVAVKLELSVHLLAAEGLGFLLCYADEHHAFSRASLATNPVGDVVLLLLMRESMDRDLLPLRHLLDCIPKLFGDLAQHHRRWDWLAPLLAHEGHQTSRSRQTTDISVQVEAVQTLHLQGDVTVQKLRNARHARDCTESRGTLLVGLRSKTS